MKRCTILMLLVVCSACELQGVGEGVGLASSKLAPNFINELLVSDLPGGMAIEFLPDGRALVVLKDGRVLIADPSRPPPLATSVYLTLSNISRTYERGLLDIAIDPDFASTRAFYLFYTPGTPQLLRISKFTHQENSGGLGSTGDLASEQVLWEDNTSFTGTQFHYGGAIEFGPDGKLYATIGDRFDATMAQDLTRAGGSLLRINRDGSIPDGSDGYPANPFRDGAGPNVDAIWAYGLRNPFRAQWDFPTNRLLIAEVGGNEVYSWEDLHVASSAASFGGANFGYPKCEGTAPHTAFASCDDPDNTPHEDPIFAYQHGGTAASPRSGAIIGGGVYRGSQFPPEYRGAYFYSDYARSMGIRYLTFDYAADPSGRTVSGDFSLEPVARKVVSLREGPDGALYYIEFSATGSLHRIVYDQGDQAPSIGSAVATPTSGPAPLTVSFDATASDADGDALSYEWSFGDGTTASGAVQTDGSIPTTQHVYGAAGPYSAILRVSDGTRTTLSPPLPIQVGVPPQAIIELPANGAMFRADDVITFRGSSSDPDETNPAAVDYRWQIQFGHNDHYHPVLDPTSLGAAGGSFAVREAAHDFGGETGFRIELTVTDSMGLRGTASVSIAPEKVALTVATVPSGLNLTIDTLPYSTPRLLDTVIGWQHTVSAPASQCSSNTRYEFASWSDGGAGTHQVTVPVTDSTLVATYNAMGSCTPPPTPVPTAGLVMRLKGDLGVSTSGANLTQWADQAGSGNVLTVSAGNPQLVPNALGGHAVVSFDGVDDGLGLSAPVGLPLGASDRSVFMVVRYDSDGWGGFVWGDPVCNATFGLAVSQASNNLGNLSLQGWCSGNDDKSQSLATGTGWLTQSVVMASNSYVHYRNGSAIDSGTHAFATGSQALRVGLELRNRGPVDMDLAEVLVYNRALSEAERAQVESYFTSEYFSTPPANQAPLAADDSASVSAAGGSRVIDVLSNDQDPDGTLDASSVALQALPAHGSASVQPTTGAITYTHDGSATTSDSFTYLVRDNQGAASNVATVTLTISEGGGDPGCEADCTPPVTSGLVLHLRADLGVTASGTNLTQWRDQTGSGNALSVTLGNPQLVPNALGGHPVVSFDGVDDGLGMTAPGGLPAGASDRSVFMVVRYDADGWGGFVWGDPVCNAAFGLAVSQANNNLGNLSLQGWCSGNDDKSQSLATGTGWLTQSVVMASNSYVHYRNGSAIDSGTHAFATGSQAVRVGLELRNRGPIDMDVAEVLVYDRALSEAERQQLESYLTARYF